MFVFFKQKTAYEMRISDWSSDVCSSDLRFPHGYYGRIGIQPRRHCCHRLPGTCSAPIPPFPQPRRHPFECENFGNRPLIAGSRTEERVTSWAALIRSAGLKGLLMVATSLKIGRAHV